MKEDIYGEYNELLEENEQLMELLRRSLTLLVHSQNYKDGDDHYRYHVIKIKEMISLVSGD